MKDVDDEDEETESSEETDEETTEEENEDGGEGNNNENGNEDGDEEDNDPKLNETKESDEKTINTGANENEGVMIDNPDKGDEISPIPAK